MPIKVPEKKLHLLFYIPFFLVIRFHNNIILVCFIDSCIALKKYDIVSKLLKQWSIWFTQTTKKKEVIF